MRKVTKRTLRRIIQEEIRNVLLEVYSGRRLYEQEGAEYNDPNTGAQGSVDVSQVQTCWDGSTQFQGECPPMPTATPLEPLVIKAAKPKRGRSWQRERRRINAMRKSGEISQADWRKGRRALSRGGVDAARIALGDVENIGLPGALKAAVEAAPGGALGGILKPNAGELEAKMKKAMEDADEGPMYAPDVETSP